jgi:alpha-tubulin suppressor-like RCC1 family protein
MPSYSGVWTLQAQMQAVAAGTWTGIPLQNLYAWGGNDAGCLGLGDTVNRSSPTQVGLLSNWDSASTSSSSFSVAVKTDGTLWS